jgi:hypothetical protein
VTAVSSGQGQVLPRELQHEVADVLARLDSPVQRRKVLGGVAAYRASIQDGQPISERKLAEMFGKTSRRWARSRMAEARQSLEPV